MNLLLFIISAILLSCCANQKTNNQGKDMTVKNVLPYDTSRYAVLPFDERMHYFFNKAKPAYLSEQEIVRIDSFYNKALAAHNAKDTNADRRIIAPEKHKIQLVAVTNEKGEKEVWVNCFCSAWNANWRKELIMVEDGGSCYYNFNVNLSAGTVSEISVNGQG